MQNDKNIGLTLVEKVNTYSNFAAFTLAEVLITLAIIGVVAAMTMPTLMNKINMIQYISKLKTDYSILSQAFLSISADNDGFKNAIAICDDSIDQSNKNNCLKSIFMAKLKKVSDCSVYSSSGGKCFEERSKIKLLNGNPSDGYYLNSDTSALVLPNGSSLLFYLDSADCSFVISGYQRCGWVTVDVNGKQKPNTFGKDIYTFLIFEKSIQPLAYDMLAESNQSGTCSAGGNGYDCSSEYLLK